VAGAPDRSAVLVDRVGESTADCATPEPAGLPQAPSELQQELLVAAMDNPYNPAQIMVYRVPGSDEGEVKVGKKRIFGDEIVLAALDLLIPGWIAQDEENCFHLTASGQKVARSLLTAP
jgi:hypothetical protein